jgi:hypothetical protein
MNKLLVNAPSGTQEVIEVGEGGGYFDQSRVLWDESQQGPIPQEMINDAIAAQTVRTVNADIDAQIRALEARITQRRLREAVLSGDMSFIADIEAQIAALRVQRMS